jgi:multidrug transporter EmrE-like cation transporter
LKCFHFQANHDYKVIALLFTDGVLNWLQNILAFSVLSLVTPLTYAVASASKRIFVIALSLLVLGNPVTFMNVVGMVMAIIGVLCYNRAKFFGRLQQKDTVLPYTNANAYNSYQRLHDAFGPPDGNGGVKSYFPVNGKPATNGYASMRPKFGEDGVYNSSSSSSFNNNNNSSSSNLLISNSNSATLTSKMMFV